MSMNSGPIGHQPIIQQAQTMQNNGGGGNLGYMRARKKQEEKEKDKLDEVILSTNCGDDSELVLDIDEENKNTNLMRKFINFILSLFHKQRHSNA